MKVTIKNLTFKNPILLASGTYGLGTKFIGVINKMGGIITKGITVNERFGNPLPRIIETPSGILNSVGLENPGVKKFKEKILPILSKLNTHIFVNIAGTTIEEFIILTEELGETEISGLEINLSCPNIKNRQRLPAQSPKLVSKIVSAIRKRTNKFLIAKLTANFVDPLDTARAAIDSGVDAVSLINTLYGIAFDINTKKPILGGITGGLSGPAIKPFALYCIWHIKQKLDIPIIGGGGIMNANDVKEFILAGAKLVAIGSGNLVDPFLGLKILKELED
ncbi:MAG: dihydroorotate dehydrogenase [candidate division WOR-3 bacterium]|nr:dihydroorotate dehydrogenase [candidate division WOR-3 bacterium]MDW7987473.1 dihydroorotate dehydrogenase [candidate division WOR-3 bacterium]